MRIFKTKHLEVLKALSRHAMATNRIFRIARYRVERVEADIEQLKQDSMFTGASIEAINERFKKLEDRVKALEFHFGEINNFAEGLEKRIEALEPKPEVIVKAEGSYQIAHNFFDKPDILQRDPVELFKEDRQPWYTASSIKMMRFLGIKTVDQLVCMTPRELHRLALKRHMSVGKKTIAYINNCLARHNLKLRGDK